MGDRAAPPWTAADNELLVRAWSAAAIESAPKPATARAVFAHLQQLSGDGDSGRAEKAVQARRSLLLNMHAVIRTHDARLVTVVADLPAVPPPAAAATDAESLPVESAWFQLPEPERRARFAEINKRGWMQFVNVSAEMFADMSALKSLSACDAADVSENEATGGGGGSDDELSARTVRWRAEDTSALLRAWEQVALEGAPRRVTVREIVQRFEQLADGGSSGRAEVSVVQRHTILRNMHAVIHAHDARVLTDTEPPTTAAELGGGDEPSAPRLWFSLTEDERRRSFAELNTRKWLQYAKLSEEQFVTISTIKSLAPAPPIPVVVSPADAAEADRVGEFAVKTHRWRSDDTTLLVRAWAEVALETAKVTAKEVARRFETLSEGGCSGRSITAVPQKHTVIRNMYTIICVHDERAVADAARSGERVPRLWFDLSKDERRRFFSEMNRKAWTHYVELTEEQFHAISTIKNSRMTEPGALSGAATDDTAADGADAGEPTAVPATSETAQPVKIESRQPTPRAFWSTKNTMLLLRAWAEARVAKGNPHPPLSEVVQHFQTLSTDNCGQSNESSIRLRHNMLHNMYNIICEYNGSVVKDAGGESKTEERLPWFSLVYDERRHYFTAMNTKTSCWFVDLSEDHFRFIAENAKRDVGVRAEPAKEESEAAVTADVSQVRRPRGMWTTEHTTTMLRAWREVVSDKSARKPTTGTVYQHFLELSDGSGGAESSFIHRFRSMRFLHSIVMAYGGAGADTTAGGSTDADESGIKRNDVYIVDNDSGVDNKEDDITRSSDKTLVTSAADDSAVVTSVDNPVDTGVSHLAAIRNKSDSDTVLDSTEKSSGDNDDAAAGADTEVCAASDDTTARQREDDDTGVKRGVETTDVSSDTKENDDKTDGADTGTTEGSSSANSVKGVSSDGVPDDAHTAASVTKWFELPPTERRRYFNDAGGKALLFVDVTREQFDELASILADKSLPLPMITRRADARDTRDSSGDGKKRVRRKKSRPEESGGEEQAGKQRKLLPAPAAAASPISKLGADSSGDSGEETAYALVTDEFGTVAVTRVKAAEIADGGDAWEVRGGSRKRQEPSPPASSLRLGRDGGSDESEPEDHDALEPRRPFRGAVEVASSSSDEQQLKRRRTERLLRDLHAADARRPPEKRVRAQSRLLAAASLMAKQTRALEKMLRRSRAARARDQAERRSIATSLAADEQERREAADVARGRLNEVRRQRAAWRGERDALKLALEAEGGAMCE